MTVLKKAESMLSKSILAVCALGMAVITLIICLQVLCRYLLGDSLDWAEELTLYIEVYVIFLASGYALGAGQHICMDLVVSKLPRVLGIIIGKITAVLCLAYSVAMTCYCWNFMLAETGQKMATLPGYKWMVYLAMVLGSALMVIYSIVLILRKPAASSQPETTVEGEEI